MTFSDLIPLIPILIATGTAVVLLLIIAIKRNHALTCATAIAGIFLAGVSAMLMMSSAPQQVTPLIIIDQFALFFTVLTCAVTVIIAVFSFSYLFHLNDHVEEFYILLTVATIGALVMVSSNHFVSAFLGLETLSVSLYGMVAYPLHSREAAKYPLEAAVKYLVLSAVASGLILFGIALVYAMTGTLEFADLSNNTANSSTGLYAIALLLVSAGITFKLSLAPFHIWTPDVYEGSPLPATAFLATVGKAVMFVLLLRYFVMTNALAFEAVATVFTLMAIVSILLGNLLALMQENIKRLLAYSSIAHMGYLLIALIATSQAVGPDAVNYLSIEAISFYLLAYVIMSLGAFGVATVISSSEKEFDFISDYQGLFWRDPWLALIFTAMLLSLAGIPLTVGFIGKFYIFLAGVESSLWLLLAVLVIGSGIGLYYYLRIIYKMLLPTQEKLPYREADAAGMGSHVVLAILLFLLILLGVYPSAMMSLVETVSATI